jgi:hypothetical protein
MWSSPSVRSRMSRARWKKESATAGCPMWYRTPPMQLRA